MDKRRLGATDFDITPIGLGCMQFAGAGLVEGFYPVLDQDRIGSIVGAALDGGVNWFDTAEMYGQGHSERSLTTALLNRGVLPGSVVIATKWAPLFRGASSIVRTIDTRVKSLQGYPIDLHQIHMPYGSYSTISAQVRAMAKLNQAGKIKAVGVSNFSARQMEKASAILDSHGISLASNQVQISLLHRKFEKNGVLEAARRLGITLIAYAPLRSGLLTGKFHDEPDRAKSLPRIRRYGSGFTAKGLQRTAGLVKELRSIGRAYGASPAQIALSWLITFYGDTVVAIPGASKARQAVESAAAMDIRLTDKELKRLDELAPR